MSNEPTILLQRRGRVGLITIDRPKALNALDLAMVRTIARALDDWQDEPTVHAVVVTGAGGRAFCAGGDIREIRRLSEAGAHSDVERFFTEEYALNLRIARYPKPYVSLIDGICMGGGIGLSVHGAIRVATETALFAMPETGIGLFPDVGATFILPRLRGDYGMYMALTGARVGGADATWLGLATHFVKRSSLAGLVEALAADGVGVLAGLAVQAPPGPLATLDVRAFGLDSVPAILAALEASGDHDTVATMRHVSPSALLWTFAIMRKGAHRTLEACLAAELALTRHATRHPDFLEGVRAMVVDKDRSPKWTPARIEDVDPAMIDAVTA